MTIYRIKHQTNHGGSALFFPEFSNDGAATWEPVPWLQNPCRYLGEAETAIQYYKDKQIKEEVVIAVE